ncbi:flavin monoamine oxidase family protein [Janthinobacterium agaricidamnosum]|uniref:Putative L-tryptophan oxidase VioA n=1 Tax=Janthinobacterium agaricidamnosum NBRC 102515 = DSM 9628 TaxID=1349767 RepID=W0V275_9BURK|nr:FAD-dependent oxidoreductase [Janthinobacterium agaricidamnosum]CDG81735.1 putative L-tryptophan oxidase VioA [Janthinobacterium agaricidamnosum NBRC 102515 = DSM 9628]
MTNYSDICIVGAGIGGLACAARLSDTAIARHLRIRVFDLNAAVGGRIQSQKIDGEEIAELGAARYSPQLHPHFEQLMQGSGLPHAVYPFTQALFHDRVQEKLKTTLLGLKKMLKEHPNDSFLAFLSQYLGAAEATRMIKATGYDALLLPMVSAAMAYDIIKKHPETQHFTENADNQWRYATDGYGQLLGQLQRQAQAAGVEFQLEHRLLSLEKSGAEHVLSFQHRGATQVHRARHLIMAIPPSAMARLNLDFPAAWSPFQYDSLPLFKGFLTFDTPWWQALGLTDKVLMADNPLRKIYFKSDKYLLFYTDSKSATYWQDSLEQGEGVYLQRVRSHLEAVLPLDGQPLPPIKTHFYKHWPHGVEFCLEPEAEHPTVLLHQDGIISCSDAYTPHCGWMEGSLIGARQASRLLLERLGQSTETAGAGKRPLTSADEERA